MTSQAIKVPGSTGLNDKPPSVKTTSSFVDPVELAPATPIDVTGVQKEQEFVPTAERIEETPSAPVEPANLGEPGEFANITTAFESKLAEQSQLGEDLSTNASHGIQFLPETPEDMPTATHWNVTDEQTVQSQFASVMDSDNPAFQVVQEAIKRQAAANGQANSQMASRAAVMAIAEVGFQIASADAATFARSAEFNAAMDNQFGLAKQAFMHQALLNEQNFRQGVMMLREDHLSQIEKINADLASRAQLLGMQANIDLQMEATKQQNVLAQMDRAHNHNVDSMNAQMEFDWNRAEQNQRMALEQMGAQGTIDQRMARTNAQNQMAINDQTHRAGLETMEAQFQYNWATSGQQQDQALERMDRETANEIYRAEAQAGWQSQLNYMSEVGQNSRMLLGAMGDIGSNPNITAAQARAAMQDVLRQYNAVNEQLAAVYSMPRGGTAATDYLYFSDYNFGSGASPYSPQIPFYTGKQGPSVPTTTRPRSPTNATAPRAPSPSAPAPTSPTSTSPVQRPPVNGGFRPASPIAIPPSITPNRYSEAGLAKNFNGDITDRHFFLK